MDAAHAPLLSVMRSPPSGQVVIAAVQVDGKAVAVVFADGLAEPALAIERIGALARAAGESLGTAATGEAQVRRRAWQTQRR